MPKIDHEKIIREYRAAYKAANGRAIPEGVSYEAGWFIFRGSDGYAFHGRKRSYEIIEMTTRLKERAARIAPQQATA
jgi:hypothetical protein